jgi:hypothetical protein
MTDIGSGTGSQPGATTELTAVVRQSTARPRAA